MGGTFFVDVAEGRRLAIDETGDPSGIPILFCHGWPASRLQGSGFGVEARALGARILAPDRPGIGLSSPQPHRQLLDWPPIVERTVDQLGIDRFRILAISGGAPYALATAFALPTRVEAVAVVSGAPPLAQEVDKRALLAVYRWLLAAYRMKPALVRSLFRTVRPVATIRPPVWAWPFLLRFVPAADRAALRDPAIFEGSFGVYREAWRGDAQGVVSDAEVHAHDWGFRPEDVTVPVRLWHGKADRSFSWLLAEALAQRLPSCQTHFIENEGHYSLPIRHRMAILRDLVESGTRAESKK